MCSILYYMELLYYTVPYIVAIIYCSQIKISGSVTKCVTHTLGYYKEKQEALFFVF